MRPTTIDSYRERLGRVLAYIRENLDEPLTIECLAGIACLSPFHFHRIFSAFVGETVNAHVRRVRLEHAAMRIVTTGESMTEAALSVGYETPAAFARAFREHFGVSPSEYRWCRQGAGPFSVERCSMTGDVAMKASFRELGDTPVLYVRKTGAYGDAAKEAWGVVMGFAYRNRIITPDTRAIGIGYDDPTITEAENIRYDACVTFSGEVQPEGDVGVQVIAGGRFAVFLHKGPYEGLADVYRAIFGTWLPASDSTLRDQPCFEVYLNRDPRRTKPERLRTEIWIPVA